MEGKPEYLAYALADPSFWLMARAFELSSPIPDESSSLVSMEFPPNFEAVRNDVECQFGNADVPESIKAGFVLLSAGNPGYAKILFKEYALIGGETAIEFIARFAISSIKALEQSRPNGFINKKTATTLFSLFTIYDPDSVEGLINGAFDKSSKTYHLPTLPTIEEYLAFQQLLDSLRTAEDDDAVRIILKQYGIS